MTRYTNRQFFAALALTAAAFVLPTTTPASEAKSVSNIHTTRLERLSSQNKSSVSNIHTTRLERLSSQNKSSVSNIHTTRLERLSNQTKAVE